MEWRLREKDRNIAIIASSASALTIITSLVAETAIPGQQMASQHMQICGQLFSPIWPCHREECTNQGWSHTIRILHDSDQLSMSFTGLQQQHAGQYPWVQM